MSDWNPARYGTFLEWRTRPARDLLARVSDLAPQRIVDLGCGPGNSTALCAAQWPSALITGIDSSPGMIAAARAAHPEQQWAVGDMAEWAKASSGDEPVDLIFSCAALQWAGDHARLFPQLLARLAKGGVLAAHMPAYDAVPNQALREMAASERWRRWFPEGRAHEWKSHALEFYHQAMAPVARWLDLWSTDYFQVMPSVDAIVEWYESTGLRPYLDRIDDASERENFLAEYRERLMPAFPVLPEGGVPFRFRRLFVVAGV